MQIYSPHGSYPLCARKHLPLRGAIPIGTVRRLWYMVKSGKAGVTTSGGGELEAGKLAQP
jgi:hypothetical protein